MDIITENITGIIVLTILIISIIIFVYLIKRFRQKTNKKGLLFKDFSVGQFSIIMFRKIGDRFHEIDRKNIKITDQQWRYNNKDFVTFNISDTLFSDRRKNYYGFDYDSGSQLTFKTKGMPDKITIDDVDIYVNRHLIEELVKGLEELKPKGQWMMLIIGIALGIAVGIIIGTYVMPQASQAVTNTPIPTHLPTLNLAIRILEMLK